MKKGYTIIRKTEDMAASQDGKYKKLSYLFPWWPVQALLHTKRIIFSGPRFLLGDAVTGVMAPCMKDGVLLISVPYFKLL